MILEGQNAIVTGGSSGIGRTVAELLGRKGAAVVVNYVGPDGPADEVVRGIVAGGGRAVALSGDIRVPGNVTRLFDVCMERFGRPHILVANAGVGAYKALGEITDEDYAYIYDVNVKGTLYCLNEAARRLNDGGSIVVVSSSTVRFPQEGLLLYISSKAALNAMVEVASLELGKRGISVNSIMPGLTLTPLAVDGHLPELPKTVAEATPCGRLGTPEEVAGAIVMLMEKEAHWISGQNIVASGGGRC